MSFTRASPNGRLQARRQAGADQAGPGVQVLFQLDELADVQLEVVLAVTEEVTDLGGPAHGQG
jgi:hypothetical protein